MYKKVDSTIENPVFKEMITTEQSYNASLHELLLAFVTKGTSVDASPLLKKLKESILKLITISDDMLLNAKASFEEGNTETAHEIFRNQRNSLLNAFFAEYKTYRDLYSAYAEQAQKSPDEFKEMTSYFQFINSKKGPNEVKSVGFQALLIQPVQRGPRYELLIKAALQTPKGLTHRNIEELKTLEGVVAEFLFENKSGNKSPYWFGKITYELLWGDSSQPGKVVIEAPEKDIVVSSPSSESPKKDEKKPYKFGDFLLKPALGLLLGSTQQEEETDPANDITFVRTGGYKPGNDGQ